MVCGWDTMAGAPRPPRPWRCAERESAGLHSRSQGLRRDLCGRKGVGETRLSRICLMRRFLHIPERLASLRREPGWGVGRWQVGSRDTPAMQPWGLGCWGTMLQGVKISHVTGARNSIPWARRHQPGGRGCGGSPGWAAPGALMAHLAQTIPSVGRAGGCSQHNYGAAAPAGSGGERGTVEMLGLARWRGSARLGTRAKPPRARPLPAARVSGTTPPPLVLAVCFPDRAASSACTSAIFIAGLFGKFYFPCFPYGETEAGGKAPCPQLSRGPLGATIGCSGGLSVGEEEEEGLPEPSPAPLPTRVGPACVNRRSAWHRRGVARLASPDAVMGAQRWLRQRSGGINISRLVGAAGEGSRGLA